MKASIFHSRVFNDHVAAQQAIQLIVQGGIGIRNLSLISRGYRGKYHASCLHAPRQTAQSWTGMDGFLSNLFGLLPKPSMFLVSGVGMVAVTGSLSAAMSKAFIPALNVDGMANFTNALSTLGMPRQQVIAIEAAFMLDQYVLVELSNTVLTADAEPALQQNKPALLVA